MKIVALLLGFVAGTKLLLAQPAEIALWPNGAPGSEENKSKPEIVQRSNNGERRVMGIHHPSITPYLPAKDQANRTAVLVIPGGGHRMLAIDHEGYNVAQWLSDHGIAAFVLKHRLARETNSTYKIDQHALADTQRAIRLIRSRAREWNIDPAKLGAVGFSAGGELVALACMRPGRAQPGAADPLEKFDATPNFQALIYPGRSQDVIPEKGAPPIFLACAYDDRPDISIGLAEVYLRFKKAGVPAELHIYSAGGHGFGLRASNSRPAGAWADRFLEWMIVSDFSKRP